MGRGVVEEEEGVLVAALQGGGQVVDVGGCQPQRLYLGQLPVLGMRRDQVPEPCIFVLFCTFLRARVYWPLLVNNILLFFGGINILCILSSVDFAGTLFH